MSYEFTKSYDNYDIKMKYLFLKELLIASILYVGSSLYSNYKDEIVSFFKDEVIVEEEKDDGIYNEFDDPLF